MKTQKHVSQCKSMHLSVLKIMPVILSDQPQHTPKLPSLPTYYIDVFGKRFQKELEQLKKDVARWQASPEGMMSPLLTPAITQNQNPMEQGTAAQAVSDKANIDRIPPLDAAVASTGAQEAKPSDDATVRERK